MILIPRPSEEVPTRLSTVKRRKRYCGNVLTTERGTICLGEVTPLSTRRVTQPMRVCIAVMSGNFSPISRSG